MTNQSSTAKRRGWLSGPGVIVLVAFLIRFGVFFHIHSTGPYPISEVFPIGFETGQIAASVAWGLGYSSPLNTQTGPTAWITPVYPLLLAAVFKICGVFTWKAFLVAVTINCVLSALTAWVIYEIGARAFGSACGTAGAWIWTLLPPAVYYPVTWVWDMSLSAVMFALIVLATLYLVDTERTSAWAWYGALWGAGAMVNAAMVSTLPFLLGWLADKARARAADWRKLALVALGMFALVISPWFIRNYVAFHRLILFRSNFGLELWLGNNPKNPGIWSWWLHPKENPEEEHLFVRLGELGYMAQKEHESLEFIKANPGTFLNVTIRRVVNNWTDLEDPLTDALGGPWYGRAIILINALFPLLCLPGALLAYRRKSRYAFPFAATVIFFPMVYYITHTNLRYRHPLDPVLCVLAGLTITAPFARGAESHTAPEPAATAGAAAPAA